MFTQSAARLSGVAALTLGWRPHEFWASTPAELACIVDAMNGQTDTTPSRDEIKTLLEMFPDEPGY
ncbi:MAG: phage tail assembly chaperone [Alphaproteobacteria bacterium]|nr:phage tail assembly chaperone [Alphaproteobacteria bacterium]MDE2339988.1 phage tail assembly chaperone [Alphaproteobacteria bacterium]